MTQGTKPGQAPAHAEKPAGPTETSHLSQGHAGRKKAVVELMDVDLQAVSGGGSKPGIGSGSNER
jgi:hypothetical protein